MENEEEQLTLLRLPFYVKQNLFSLDESFYSCWWRFYGRD